MNLIFNLDLFIIALRKVFVIKGWLLFRTTFCCKGANRPRVVLNARWNDAKSNAEDNAFLVLLQTFYWQSFCNSGKIFFLGLPLANVDLSTVPISLSWSDIFVSNVRVFIKRVFFLLVRKLSVHVGLILLKHVGSDIRVESS